MAHQRHTRDADAGSRKKKAVFLAAPVALAATLGTVGAGVAMSEPPQTQTTQVASSVTDTVRDEIASRRQDRAELRAERKAEERRQAREEARRKARQAKLKAEREAKATAQAVSAADTKLWVTSDLNLWTESDDSAKKVGVLEEGKKVLITGRKRDGRTEVVAKGESRWVTTGYLDSEKPVEETEDASGSEGSGGSGGITEAPCPDSGPENSLTPNAVKVYRTVCNNFPNVLSYGGYAGRGEHGTGQAIDIMIPDASTGQAIADFLVANAGELSLSNVIWSRSIWTDQRSSEGWRSMEDRGSATANHEDHVHVLVY